MRTISSVLARGAETSAAIWGRASSTSARMAASPYCLYAEAFILIRSASALQSAEDRGYLLTTSKVWPLSTPLTCPRPLWTLSILLTCPRPLWTLSIPPHLPRASMALASAAPMSRIFSPSALAVSTVFVLKSLAWMTWVWYFWPCSLTAYCTPPPHLINYPECTVQNISHTLEGVVITKMIT